MYYNCEPHPRTQVGPGCELVYADNITIVANIIDDMEIIHHKFSGINLKKMLGSYIMLLLYQPSTVDS